MNKVAEMANAQLRELFTNFFVIIGNSLQKKMLEEGIGFIGHIWKIFTVLTKIYCLVADKHLN